jgi:radical SAM-linked protein
MAQFICRYRKDQEVRWISHLDLKRTFERAMRRADLPLELTQGHNPHPKMSFGPPLPMGATGEGEMFAFFLSEPMGPETVKERLNDQLPSGLRVVELWIAPPQKRKETFGSLDLAEYHLTIEGEVDPHMVEVAIHRVLESEQLFVERGGNRPERTVDLRPLLISLTIQEAASGQVVLRTRLQTGSHGGARPQEIVELLGLATGEYMVVCHRVGLYASADAPTVTEKSHGVWRRWTRSRTSRGRN